jgi:hypothetical protein
MLAPQETGSVAFGDSQHSFSFIVSEVFFSIPYFASRARERTKSHWALGWTLLVSSTPHHSSFGSSPTERTDHAFMCPFQLALALVRLSNLCGFSIIKISGTALLLESFPLSDWLGAFVKFLCFQINTSCLKNLVCPSQACSVQPKGWG